MFAPVQGWVGGCVQLPQEWHWVTEVPQAEQSSGINLPDKLGKFRQCEMSTAPQESLWVFGILKAFPVPPDLNKASAFALDLIYCQD